jgi:hypothetical protein
MFNILIPTGSSIQLEPGDAYQGGIIGYLLEPGDTGYDPYVQHGLIISPTQIVADACWPSLWPWSTQNAPPQPANQPNLTTLSAAIGTGQSNTNTIIAAYSYGGFCTYDPAKLCDVYSINGYSDWYLGSLNEMIAIGANRASFAQWDSNWTSTQQSQAYAYVVNGVTNAVQVEPKYSDGASYRYFSFRPLRSF